MAATDELRASLVIIHNSDLPPPLSVLSKAITTYSKNMYFRSNIPAKYDLEIIDISDYHIPSAETNNTTSSVQTESSTNSPGPKKSVTDFITNISTHSGFILLFPYHTWSHCTPLKTALSQLPQHILTNKPVLLMGFGQEEPHSPNEYNRTWKRKSFGMMRDFMEGKKIRVLESKWGFPEFMIYADYWPDWISGGYNGFIGGQQAELWETMAQRRCVESGMEMVRLIEERSKLVPS